jgi:hypothetical protein
VARWSKPRRGPASLSGDRLDKFIAAMSWYVGKDKSEPEFISAPFYYSAASEWFDRLSLDDQERVHTVVYVFVFSTPGYGSEKAAVTYAAMLPDMPRPPDPIRKAWGHE